MSAKWDTRFLELAGLIATWSKDPRGGVGAVIARGNRVISVGFNGFPQGVDDSRTDLYGKRVVLHAEENAILFARNLDLQGCTIYTQPLPTCVTCASRIMQVGITQVISQYPGNRTFADELLESFYLAEQNMKNAGISVKRYTT